LTATAVDWECLRWRDLVSSSKIGYGATSSFNKAETTIIV
jgi:hypothetical protein